MLIAAQNLWEKSMFGVQIGNPHDIHDIKWRQQFQPIANKKKRTKSKDSFPKS